MVVMKRRQKCRCHSQTDAPKLSQGEETREEKLKIIHERQMVPKIQQEVRSNS